MWQHLQRSWFLDVNEFARDTPLLHAPIRIYAEYGVVLLVLALLLAWWRARADQNPQTMAAALWAPLGTLLAVGLNQPLADAVGEARPYAVFPHALVLIGRTQDFSFPSDHAVMAGAVAAGVLCANRRLGMLAVVVAALMAFSRVYVGAHFPLDVFAGLGFGAAVATAGYLCTRRLLVVVVSRLSLTPLRPVLRTPEGSGVR